MKMTKSSHPSNDADAEVRPVRSRKTITRGVAAKRGSVAPGAPPIDAGAVLDALADACLVVGADGRLIAANKTAVRLFGLDGDALSETRFADLVASEPRGGDFMARALAELRGGTPHTARLVLRHATADRQMKALVTATLFPLNGEDTLLLAVRDRSLLECACADVEEVLSRFSEYLDQAYIAAVFVCPQSRRVLGSNVTARELLACERAELRGLEVTQLADPEQSAKLKALLDDVTTDGQARTGDCAIVSPSGKDFLAEIHAGLIALTDRRVMQLIVTDISERRRLQDQVRETRDFLQDLIRSSHLAIITYDLNFVARSWNPEAEKIFGWEHEAALREAEREENLFTLTEEAREAAQQALSNDEPRPVTTADGAITDAVEAFVHDRRHRGGRRLIVESVFSPIKNSEGAVVGVVEFAKDISDSVKLERETSYLRELNLKIVENIPSGIIVFTREGRFKLVNRAFADLMGMAPSDILGRTPQELGLSHDSVESIRDCTRKIIETRKPSDVMIHRVSFPTGERRLRHISIPLIESNGAIRMILGIFDDVTEEETLQLQLIQSEKLAALGQLAAGIAHEIRSPLSSIYNALYDLNDIVDRSNTEAAEDIDISMEEIQRVQEIINNLLDFARSGEDSVCAVALNDMVERTIRLMAKNLSLHGIEVETRLATGDTRVEFNRNAMKQVLLNLMTNSMQAMAAGGRLTIETELLPETKQVRLTIADTGMGIPKEILGKIFDPFFTTKEPGRGTGLGLSVVHTAVIEHGGKVTVKSKVGEGTNFTILLTLAECAKHESSEQLPGAPESTATI